MKAFKYIMTVIAAAVAIAAFSSCRKMSHNGKLDGQWQIQSVENTETGEVTSPYPKHYYCLNLHVVNLKITDLSATISGNMQYDKDASTVTMDFRSFPYSTEEANDRALGEFGVYENPVTFDIIELNDKEMVLKSPQSVVRMRRF